MNNSRLLAEPGELPFTVVNDLKPNGFVQPVSNGHVTPNQKQAHAMKSAVQQVAWDVADAAKQMCRELVV